MQEYWNVFSLCVYLSKQVVLTENDALYMNEIVGTSSYFVK